MRESDSNPRVFEISGGKKNFWFRALYPVIFIHGGFAKP
jgi:hypothetical protein